MCVDSGMHLPGRHRAQMVRHPQVRKSMLTSCPPPIFTQILYRSLELPSYMSPRNLLSLDRLTGGLTSVIMTSFKLTGTDQPEGHHWPPADYWVMLSTSYKHLDYSTTYARILFVDFSSVFNTIVPENLPGSVS
ncbi:hypothetical protein F2P81_023451 [Scophthalmus maximus]|uniref:Uncharacterized protein n=1 Tax=Scophthalmus maximus TaxID=52904 RepID=A0A6A4RWG5_SCOMX|nr:hypothetical protein F2P81_023451 [Scophthalmus maximus]